MYQDCIYPCDNDIMGECPYHCADCANCQPIGIWGDEEEEEE